MVTVVEDAKKVDAIVWAAGHSDVLWGALCDLYSKGYYDTARRTRPGTTAQNNLQPRKNDD